MRSEKHIRFYLPDGLRQSARARDHNFLNKLGSVLSEAGFSAEYLDPDLADPGAGGYSLFHMREPFARNSVTIRRAYFYPFWQIERTNKRWLWDIAKARFDPADIDPNEAQRFYRFWRKRLFADSLDQLSCDGFVYVPLQGRLSQHRSFQTCSPLHMIEHVLRHAPDKQVIASLHPKEVYSDADLSALEQLAAHHTRLELRLGEMAQLLPRCDYVVTQNSSVAFSGFLLAKPCVTFAKIDFHHIAADVGVTGVENAFQVVRQNQPEFEKYVWWFLQKMSINAGRPEAEEKIRHRLKSLGWPV